MTLYTIGYQGHDPAGFVHRLALHGVTLVADVREVPYSRKKGFSKKGLAAFLAENGIGYRHFKGLGTTREMREAVKATGDRERLFCEYRGILDGNAHDLNELLGLMADGEIPALLCMEKNPEHCHRSAIAERLARMSPGLLVTHIVNA